MYVGSLQEVVSPGRKKEQRKITYEGLVNPNKHPVRFNSPKNSEGARNAIAKESREDYNNLRARYVKSSRLNSQINSGNNDTNFNRMKNIYLDRRDRADKTKDITGPLP